MKHNNYKEVSPYISLLMKLGIGILCCLGGGFFVGLFLDKQFNSSGLFLLIGTGIGLALSFIFLIIQVQALISNPPKDE